MNILLFGHINQEYLQKLLDRGHNVTISTQEVCVPNKLPNDVNIIVNEDPGGLSETNNKNINRHISNVYNGVSTFGDTDKVLILRGDCSLNFDKLEEYCKNKFQTHSWKTEEYTVFEHKIIIPSLYTCNPIQGLKLLFHPGDWFRYGYVKDIKFLYDIPYHSDKDLFAENGFLRYRSEQYIFIKCLQKKYDLDIEYDVDTGFELIQKSIKSLLNNFIVIDIEKIQLVNSKYIPPMYVGPPAFINELYYKQLLDNYRHIYNES